MSCLLLNISISNAELEDEEEKRLEEEAKEKAAEKLKEKTENVQDKTKKPATKKKKICKLGLTEFLVFLFF